VGWTQQQLARRAWRLLDAIDQVADVIEDEVKRCLSQRNKAN
jgi:hypothetical protein